MAEGCFVGGTPVAAPIVRNSGGWGGHGVPPLQNAAQGAQLGILMSSETASPNAPSEFWLFITISTTSDGESVMWNMLISWSEIFPPGRTAARSQSSMPLQ